MYKYEGDPPTHTHTHIYIDIMRDRRIHLPEHTSTRMQTQHVPLMPHPTEMSKCTTLTSAPPPLREIWQGVVKCYATCISQPVGLSRSLYLFTERTQIDSHFRLFIFCHNFASKRHLVLVATDVPQSETIILRC